MDRLALDGGAPVREQMLPYGRQWIDEDDIASVVQVLRSDWITQGPKIGEFEARHHELTEREECESN